MTDEQTKAVAVLLPCPWCRSKPTSKETPCGWDVTCENEECPATISALAFSQGAAEYAWNNRRTTQPPPEQAGSVVPEDGEAPLSRSWRALVNALADDLESEIENRRAGDLPRRIERDLEVVRTARKRLAAAPAPKETP